MNARPLAVWDVDGTLVDSRRSIQQAMTAAFQAENLAAPPYDATRRIVGLSLPEAVSTLAPDLPADRLARLTQAYKDAWVEMHARPGFQEPLYPGAAALLERLRAEGWQLAMATGKSRRGVEAVVAMHGWADVFASTHCADDGPGKPHPAMLHAALAALGAQGADTVMIGDTSFDMAMAQAAGARAQGVAWGFHTPDEVRAGGAVHVAADMEELGAELDRFARARADA